MKYLWLFLVSAITIPFIKAAVVWNTEYVIKPSITDPNILDAQSGQPGFGSHSIFVNLSSPNVPSQPLFVFLPGTAVQSSGYEQITNMGASIGWKAIGLAWNNSHDPAELDQCGSMLYISEECQMEYRLDTLIGGAYTNAENSVVYRLYKLLLYLNAQYPTQGWNAFYNKTDASADDAESALVWDKMAWGGHSQGGGTSQLIGMRYSVRRVLQLAPSGIITTIAATSDTPTDAYYLFAHDRDTTIYVVNNVVSVGPLTDLVAYGSEFYVDDQTSFPSHILKTNSTAGACASFACHACVAFDTNLEKDSNGYPVFYPVWKHMLGDPIYLPSPSATPSHSPPPASPSRSPSPPSPSRSPPASSPSSSPLLVTPSVTPTTSIAPSTAAISKARNISPLAGIGFALAAVILLQGF